MRVLETASANPNCYNRHLLPSTSCHFYLSRYLLCFSTSHTPRLKIRIPCAVFSVELDAATLISSNSYRCFFKYRSNIFSAGAAPNSTVTAGKLVFENPIVSITIMPLTIFNRYRRCILSVPLAMPACPCFDVVIPSNGPLSFHPNLAVFQVGFLSCPLFV